MISRESGGGYISQSLKNLRHQLAIDLSITTLALMGLTSYGIYLRRSCDQDIRMIEMEMAAVTTRFNHVHQHFSNFEQALLATPESEKIRDYQSPFTSLESAIDALYTQQVFSEELPLTYGSLSQEWQSLRETINTLETLSPDAPLAPEILNKLQKFQLILELTETSSYHFLEVNHQQHLAHEKLLLNQVSSLIILALGIFVIVVIRLFQKRKSRQQDLSYLYHANLEKNRLFQLVQQSATFIAITSYQGRIVYLNPLGVEIMNLGHLGKLQRENHFIWKLLSGKQRNYFFKFILPKVRQEGSWQGELTVSPLGNQASMVCFTEIFSLRSPPEYIAAIDLSDVDFQFLHGQMIAVVAQDITGLKETEKQLRQALKQEQQLHRLKAEFINTVSHEFRTPLTAIFSSAELLKKYSDRWSQTKQTKYFDQILFCTNKLNQMLNDVLVVGKMESGKLTFNPQAIAIQDFCQDVAKKVAILDQESHEITLAWHQETTLPETLWVRADPIILEYVLTNLLVNACKYSPGGSPVAFQGTLAQDQGTFSVVDWGLGIPEDEQQFLFETFHRCRNVADISGTGLGLSIVAQGLALHGGKITVNSREGEGTTMTITIPWVVVGPGGSAKGAIAIQEG